MTIDDIIRDGGATLDGVTLEPVRPTAGYAVAIHRGTAYTVRPVARDDAGRIVYDGDILHAIHRVRDTFRPPFVGVWIDAAGVVHVDPVVILQDVGDAMAVGRAFAQQSVWSFRDGLEVTL